MASNSVSRATPQPVQLLFDIQSFRYFLRAPPQHFEKRRCASTFWDQFNVFAGRDFCLGPRPAAVFRRAHMQAQAAAARGSRRAGLQQRSEHSPYVSSVLQTPPQHFQKKNTQEPFSISFSCSPAGIFVSSTAARGGRRTGL